MNLPDKKTPPHAGRPNTPFGVVLAALAMVGGALGGCADIRRATTLPPVNPESPVAAVVAAAAMQNYKRPSLASVPPKPLNVPPPDAVKTAVIAMVRCRRSYEIWVAAHPAAVSGTAGFGETLQARLDNNPADRPTPAEAAAAEAEAAKMRAFAEPPPPMQPGPPPTPSQAAPPALATPAASPIRRPRAPAPAQVAAASPPAAVPAAGAPAAEPNPAPASQTFAVVEPSMSPQYNDPLLAHCR